MSVVSIIPPFPVFADRAGAPLTGGKIYIGAENLDPLTTANQIAIFSDRAMDVALSQPVRTTGGYAVDSDGAPTNIYAATNFAMTITDRNGVMQLSTPSYGFAVLAEAITFDALTISTSILPDTAGGATDGSLVKPWALTATRDLQAKVVSVYNTTQPSVAADLAKLSQLSVDLLVCRQTSSGVTATLVNIKNAASIVRDSAGVYTVTPSVALPANYVVEAHPAAFSAGTTPIEVVCTTRGTASLVISVRLNNVATDFAWDLVIKGNPAVADPIS